MGEWMWVQSTDSPLVRVRACVCACSSVYLLCRHGLPGPLPLTTWEAPVFSGVQIDRVVRGLAHRRFHSAPHC